MWSFRYFIKMRPTFEKETVDEECRYVIEKRLSDDYSNEAAWAYLRGMIASTKEEEEQSMATNAKRVFIGDLEWLMKKLTMWAEGQTSNGTGE